MPGIHIVTDSGSDLRPQTARELGVTVVPLTIRFGDTEHRDGTELSPEDFYAEMAAHDELPSTAAPAPGAFIEAFEAAAEAGADRVLCIDMAGSMSATIDAARNAASEVADRIPVHVVDSQSVSGGLQSLIRRAVEAAADGHSVEEIVSMVEERADRTTIFGTFETLENLKKGGRIGGASAFVGTVLKIKPIVEVHHGEVHEAAKQRTRRKALAWIVDQVRAAGALEDLMICEAMAPDVDEFRSMFDDGESIEVIRLGPTIGTHGGPGTLGVSFVRPGNTV